MKISIATIIIGGPGAGVMKQWSAGLLAMPAPSGTRITTKRPANKNISHFLLFLNLGK